MLILGYTRNISYSWATEILAKLWIHRATTRPVVAFATDTVITITHEKKLRNLRERWWEKSQVQREHIRGCTETE